jgi:hypothetical protein
MAKNVLATNKGCTRRSKGGESLVASRRRQRAAQRALFEMLEILSSLSSSYALLRPGNAPPHITRTFSGCPL